MGLFYTQIFRQSLLLKCNLNTTTCRHEFESSMFNELYRYCLQQKVLTVYLDKEPIALEIDWLFGGSNWAHLVSNSIRYNPFLTSEALFNDKRCPFGTHLTCYFAILLNSPLCMYIFLEVSIVLDFHMSPQMMLCFGWSC